ncbi:S-layer family protein [Thermodesulfitimonas autotrophica]|uniref:S-layer family protein n=1 Tax=Thermodesulfitimonas autotrophica TaxID=1894989 RepID=A0A3N5AWR0_9THEO|nr:S-layer homology domain-containing protein [Thermodesulfitimonas autotrophica]RPF49323.1 S-layer family protein [Thermodesulfitimonas autotrophica]
MVRRVSVALLPLLLAIFLWVPAALAAGPVSADDLLSVLPQPPAEGQLATRADFAAMLVEAAAIPQSQVKGEVAQDVAPDAWYAGAVATLKEKGIMSGYPGGTLQPERPVTRTEAVVLVARTFGLFTTISAPEAGPLPQGHWAGSLYNWMYSQGIAPAAAAPEERLTVAEAAAFLSRVFGSDPEASAIVEKSAAAMAKVTAFRGKTTMDIATRLRPGVNLEVGSAHIEATTTFQAPGNIASTSRLDTVIEGKPVSLSSDFYVVDGNVYFGLTDLQTGKKVWQRFPQEFGQAFTEAMANTRNQVLPPELRPYLHYQLLGTTKVGNREVYEIGAYGRVDDPALFLKALGKGGEGLQKMMPTADFFPAISYWGRLYIGKEDLLLYGGDLKTVAVYKETMGGQPNPLEAIETVMHLTDYAYGGGITVVLPPEAANAPEVTLPPAGEGNAPEQK